MESIAERLQKLMDAKGVSAYVLSKETGVSTATLSRVLNKDARPNMKTSKSLAQYFGISTTKLLTGEDYNKNAEDIGINSVHEFEYLENNNSNSFIKLESGQYLMTMPLAEFNIQAGLLEHYTDVDYMEGIAQHSIIVDTPGRGRYLAFRVSGDSMNSGGIDAILPNSIVATRELQRQHWTSKLRFKDFPYWVIYTTEAKMPLLKEITAHDVQKGVITCHSLNTDPGYQDFDLSLNDVQALFYVVNVQRDISKRSYF